MYFSFDLVMPVSFMLNFPKVKKAIRDEDKLLQYLQEDEKYHTRNYEINFEERIIRKKQVEKEKDNSKQEDVSVEEGDKGSSQ